MENGTVGRGRDALIGLVAGVSALVAPSLNGCRPSPNQADIEYVRDYVESNDNASTRGILGTYEFASTADFRECLDYYNARPEKEKVKLESLSDLERARVAPHMKDGKLTDTHKAAIGKFLRDWDQTSFSF